MWLRSCYPSDNKPKLPSLSSRLWQKVRRVLATFILIHCQVGCRGRSHILLYINYFSLGVSYRLFGVKKPIQFLTSSLGRGQNQGQKSTGWKSDTRTAANHWPFFMTSDQCCLPGGRLMIRIFLRNQMSLWQISLPDKIRNSTGVVITSESIFER